MGEVVLHDIWIHCTRSVDNSYLLKKNGVQGKRGKITSEPPSDNFSLQNTKLDSPNMDGLWLGLV